MTPRRYAGCGRAGLCVCVCVWQTLTLLSSCLQAHLLTGVELELTALRRVDFRPRSAFFFLFIGFFLPCCEQNDRPVTRPTPRPINEQRCCPPVLPLRTVPTLRLLFSAGIFAHLRLVVRSASAACHPRAVHDNVSCHRRAGTFNTAQTASTNPHRGTKTVPSSMLPFFHFCSSTAWAPLFPGI